MKCRNCNRSGSRIVVVDGEDNCTRCSGIGETGGTKVDGLITRGATRIREQQRAYEKDFTPPHVYDKAKKKVVPNTAFIQAFPTQASKTFTSDEMKSVGVTKLTGKP